MPRDLNKGLLKYIKGPSYSEHFLIGTFGGDSARARLSGASRYIYIIATGYESKSYLTDISRHFPGCRSYAKKKRNYYTYNISTCTTV